MDKLNMADEEYYITSEYLLNLASRASELFKSSEPIEKRQLLRFALQNFTVEGNLVLYEEKKTFDKIRLFASRRAWLAPWDNFRHTDWSDITPYPNLLLENARGFVQVIS